MTKPTTITIYEVQQVGNKFCGPSVLSAIIGITTGEAAMLIRKVGGRSKIFGTYTHEISQVLRLCGYRLTLVRKVGEKYGTMRAFSKKYAKANHSYLIDAGHHWEVLHDRNQAICGLTKVMVHIEDHPKVRSQIKEAYLIERIENLNPIELVEKNKPKKPSKSSEQMTAIHARRKAKALMTQYGMDFDNDFDSSSCVVSGTVMVYPPRDLFPDEEDDPHAWDHVCYGWVAALVMVEEYVELIKKKKNND